MGKLWTEIEGASNAANRFVRFQGFMSRELRRTIDETADDAIIVYQAHAPRRSGRLARGIFRKGLVGGGEEIGARAVDPRSGFDYVAVSRFGHVKKVIKPKPPRKYLEPHMGRNRSITFLTKSVKGFTPKGDWVDKARHEVEAEAARNMRRFGTRMNVRGI